MSVSNIYGDVCRACTKKDNEMKCIFNSEVNSVPVSQMLSFATPLMIRPDDGLPTLLCSNCLQMLISFYKFQQMCIESDQKFRTKPVTTTGASHQSKIIKVLNQHQQQPAPRAPAPKLRPPPPPPDDYMTHKGRVHLDWNSYEPLPVEVSDEDDLVLKFECDNDILLATGGDASDVDVIDEYEQFDKLPIIDVRIDEKPNISKPGSANKTSDDEEVVLFTINASIPTEPEIFDCKICGLGFDLQEALEKHIKTHYTTEAQPSSSLSPSQPVMKAGALTKLAYICTVCKMAFGGQDRLAMHKKTHDKQGLTRSELTQQNIKSYSFECNTCEKFYNNQESYDRHPCVPVIHSSNGSLTKHPSFEEKRLYTCNICKKAFQTWDELTKHISEHQIKILYGSDPGSNTTVNVNVNIQTDKSHECEVCQKSFSSWDEIKVHWQQHTDKSSSTAHNNAITVSTSSDVKPLIPTIMSPEESPKLQPKLPVEDSVSVYNQHACSICGKLFSQFYNLKHHLKIKHKKKASSEDEELEELKSVDALRAYRILRLYECGTCGKTFDRQSHLLRHKKIHEKKFLNLQNAGSKYCREKRSYQCELCGIFVANEGNLRRHVKRIHQDPAEDDHLQEEENGKEKEKAQRMAEEDGQQEDQEKTSDLNRMTTRQNKDRPFVCSCGKRFQQAAHRDQHKLLHDLGTECDESQRNCKVCKRRFKSSTHLKQHMIKHKLFKCPTCGEKFARSHNLQIHEKMHCDSKKAPRSDSLKCDICSTRFTTKNNTIRHMKRIHGIIVSTSTGSENRMQYTCAGCSKSFSQLASLKDHEYCHRAEKKEISLKEDEPHKETEKEKKTATMVLPYNDPHKCLECRLVVSTRGCLKKHMARKHKKLYYPFNPQKYFVQCACTKPFDSNGSLLKHIRAHIVKPNTSIKYGCHFCFIDRTHAWQIRRHLKDSHAVSLEELETIAWKLCSYCKTNFMNSKELRRHMRMKHGKKENIVTKTVYKCKTCDKSYFDKNLMLRHVKGHKSKGTLEERSTNFSEEKWPTCQFCNKAFAKGSRVQRHLGRVHNFILKDEDLVVEGKK